MALRSYLVDKAMLAESDESTYIAHGLLVLHDAGLLESTRVDDNGEPVFVVREDATDEQLDAAQTAYLALNECDDDAWTSYMLGVTN